MPRRVQGPDGVIHEFPDDATDAEISTALESMQQPSSSPAQTPNGPTWTDRAVALLPTAGGVVGGLVGGIGGTVAGMGVGGVPGAVAGAALGGGAGKAYEQLINFYRGKGAPSTPADAAKGIAGEAALQGGAEVVGAGLAKGMAKAAPRLMESAVKPTQALLKDYRTTAPKLVQTLLDEGINVTKNGVAKLEALFDATNAEIKEAIAHRDALLERLGLPGPVQPKAVAARALDTASKLSKQVNPTEDLKAIGETVKGFLDHPVYQGRPMTLGEAQAAKIGTYQQIGKKFGQLSSAQVETEKALARGLKEEIAANVPGISALNQRDSDLMAALDAVGRRVAVADRRDVAGISTLASHPMGFLAMILDRSPAVKSLLARGMYSAAGKVAGVAPEVLRAAVAAVAQSGLEATPAAPAAAPPAR